MSIAQLKNVTQLVKTNQANPQPTSTDNSEVARAMQLFISEYQDDVEDIIPNLWVAWVDNRYIQPLWNPKFWKAVSGKECYMYTKFSRRFFPTVGSEEWKETSTESYKQNYPAFDETTKHSNFTKSDNIKLHTNFGMIPQLDLALVVTETAEIKLVIDLVVKIRNEKLSHKLWYHLACNYELCHLVMKDCVELTRAVFDRDRELVIGGLFWTNYILSHEESTCTNPTEQSRFVFTLSEVLALDFINDLPADQTPWIINALRHGNNVYNCMPFYLAGKRSLADLATLRARVEVITHGCFKGFETLQNVSLVGSTAAECIGNNALLRCASSHTESGFISCDLASSSTSDIEQFTQRSDLYYPLEGEFSSDLDLAITIKSYKEFINIAQGAIDIMNQNMIAQGYEPFKCKEDCTASGVRFHLTHQVMRRKIEIFRTPQTPMRLVVGFHVAPVRMYWNFRDDPKMSRSCAAALVTGIGENFNWFSSNKVPADVILKNAQRGISTICNQTEMECLSAYLQKSQRWGYGFSNLQEITGSFTEIHPFFRVDAIPRGIRYGLDIRAANVGNYKNNIYKLSNPLHHGDTVFTRYAEHDNTFRITAPPVLFA